MRFAGPAQKACRQRKRHIQPRRQDDVEVDERIRRLVASEFPALDDKNAASFLAEWGRGQTENVVALDTKHGRIVVELFDDVPVHRANFLYKVYRRYFDPSEFTRVVPDFVVQGGNSEEERPQQLRFLIGQHTLPAEFKNHHIHSRGALAMSRSYSDNPDKRSSGYDFYIVTGRKIGAQELGRIQKEKGAVTPEIKRRSMPGRVGHPIWTGSTRCSAEWWRAWMWWTDWRQRPGTAAIGQWSDWKFG